MSSLKNDKISLFIFIDALGWEILKKHPDFLPDRIKHSKPLETILGYSSACDPSIISGRTPSEHGLWSSYYHDPTHSPFKWVKPLALLPDFIFNRGRVRSFLSRWIKKQCGFTGYFQLYQVPFKQLPLFNYAEQKRIWAPGGLPNADSIFDVMAQKNIPYFTHDSADPDEVRLNKLCSSLERRAIEFAYCSLGRLDALLHREGPDSPGLPDLIQWYDRQIRTVLDTAGKNYENVDWYIFTDHGMHAVSGTYDLMHDVNALPLKWEQDFVAFYDSTMARFWFRNEHARNLITATLNAVPAGRILSETELREQGVYFDGGQYGDLIFLMKSGVQIVPGFMGDRPCKGMHGFDPEDPDSKAQISSHKPIPEEITKIQDIYHLMRHELNLD